MRKRILFLAICLVFIFSSVCFAQKLLNSDWDYIGKGSYGGNMSPENEIYCNRKSVRHYKNGNIRLVACFYYPPNNVMSKDEVYLLYDFEINGFDRLFMHHDFEMVLHDGRRTGEGLPKIKSGWQPFSPKSVHQRLFDIYYRR